MPEDHGPGIESQREATAAMANIPRKMQDPTETALSAIQEALSANEPGRHNPAPPVQPDPSQRAARPADQDLFLDEGPGGDQPPPRRAK